MEGGHCIEVRGQEVLEEVNRTSVLEMPLERCIILPGRSNSVFAAIAETVWVLAGRDDIAFLEPYLPRAADYSDDGLAWRAGYGPRIRRWGGVDPVRELTAMLRDDPNTRRAVTSIFDPGRDFVASKDIPCTNWMHFLLRDGRLLMNVVIRSNDVMWGFSGINTFEWSVLHELLANWVGSEVGEATFFSSSFHLYQRHYQRGRHVLDRFSGKTCYEFGLRSPRSIVGLEDMDDLLALWFSLEAKIRLNPDALDLATPQLADPLFNHFLQIQQIYYGLRQWSAAEVALRIGALPETDLTAAACEYAVRKNRIALEFLPHERVQAFLGAFDGSGATDSEDLSLEKLFSAIALLHAEKNQAYGDSWKKRGEQISIMANIARKVDRIANSVSMSPPRDESLFDTAVDLLVYCLKYETFLAELDDGLARQLFGDAPPTSVPHSENLARFNFLLDKCRDTYRAAAPVRGARSAERIGLRFSQLERCFGGEVCEAVERLRRCVLLADQVIAMIKGLVTFDRDAARRFISAWSGSAAEAPGDL